MKRTLFALITLLATSTAFADSYCFIEDFEVNESEMGTMITVPVKASFEGRVDSWQVEIELPDGLSYYNVVRGSDMRSISYLDENGNQAALDAQINSSYNESEHSITVTGITSPTEVGYWYNNGSLEPYGTVKWEPSLYEQMFKLRLFVEYSFLEEQNQTITVKTIPYSDSDPRGGTVADIGDAGQEFIMQTQVHASILSPMPAIYFEPDGNGVLIRVDFDGVLLYAITVNGEVIEQSSCSNAPFEYYIPAEYESERVIDVYASEIMPGYDQGPEAHETIVLAQLERPYTPQPILSYDEDTHVVTIEYEGDLFMMVNGLEVSPVENGNGSARLQLHADEYDDVSYYIQAQANLDYPYLPSSVAEMHVMVPAQVQKYDFMEGGIYYKITGDQKVNVYFESTSYNSYSGNVVIPATVTHDGVTYKVTGINERAFMNCLDLTGVTIGSTVTVIGNRAFEGCSRLTSVVLGDYVINIGGLAFGDCTSLTKVTIGSGVRSIGLRAFAGCTALTSVYCKPAVPPVMIASNCFDCYATATLTVHPAVIDSYRDDAKWGQFATIVESVAVNPEPADANGDGAVTIGDISALIDLLINGRP